MNREELQLRTGLKDEEISKLLNIKNNLSLIADLPSADMFIDCIQVSDGKLFVMAHSKPGHTISSYEKDVTGQIAERECEPAVYRAIETMNPVRDIKAVTQEGKTVMQDVVPIIYDEHIIGVLVGEKDISREIYQKKKLEAACNMNIKSNLIVRQENVINVEAHHRIKNQLQMIISMTNIQKRMTKNQEVKDVLDKNISSMICISTINDLMARSGSGYISLAEYLRKLIDSLLDLYGNEQISSFTLEGDDLVVKYEQAIEIASVVNEFVSNAFKHAFKNRNKGEVSIILKSGEKYSSITVCDNGSGYNNVYEDESGIGMNIVNTIVRDKLKGKVYITSNNNGTNITFDFLN